MPSDDAIDIAWRLLKDDELPKFCQSCEGAGCKGCDNTGLDVSERYHQEHEPMSVDDMESYYDESHLGHTGEVVAHPSSDDTPEGRRKQTNIMGATYRGEPTFNLMPLAGAGRPMVNPHAEIFRRSEPMDIAMRLLKSHPLNPKFQYIGTHLSRSGNKRPVGLISYDSTAGHGRRTFPFYQSTGINSDQPGTWFPFHGIDYDGWFIKPNVGMADNGYDSEQGRYGHSRFRMLSDWMVDNPMQEFEETLMGNNEINNALQASEAEGLHHTSFDTDVLKRQTELGEFHPDFPSSHGPVTEYHGTIDLPSVLEQGLEGKVMARHRAVKPPTEMEGQPVVYTTDDPDAAKRWAESRGKNLKVPSEKVGVIGVRGSNLPSVEQSDPHSQFRGTTRVRTPNIPRENITPFE